MKSIAYVITKAIEAPDWSFMEDEDYEVAADALEMHPYNEDVYKDCGSFWEDAIKMATSRSISMRLDEDEREELDEYFCAHE